MYCLRMVNFIDLWCSKSNLRYAAIAETLKFSKCTAWYTNLVLVPRSQAFQDLVHVLAVFGQPILSLW